MALAVDSTTQNVLGSMALWESELCSSSDETASSDEMAEPFKRMAKNFPLDVSVHNEEPFPDELLDLCSFNEAEGDFSPPETPSKLEFCISPRSHMSGDQDDHILPFLDDLVDLPEPDTFQSDISLPDIHTNLGLPPVQSPQNLDNGGAHYSRQNQPSMSDLPESLFSNSRHESQQYRVVPWDLYSPFSSQQPYPKPDSFQPPLPSNLSEFLPMNEAFFQRGSTESATHFHSQNPSFEQFRSSQPFNAHCHVPGQSGSIQSDFRDQCPPAFPSSQDFLPRPEHSTGQRQTGRASRIPSFEKADPTKRRGRPRLYDTSIPSDQAAQTSEPANTKEAVTTRRKRGAKPKYKYNTEAEAVAKRRERNRKTAISSYYKRKTRDAELEQEIQELEKEKEALYALSHLLQGPDTNREAIAAILEETNSGMQTLELLKQPK